MKTFLEAISKFIDENKISGIIIAGISFFFILLFSITPVYEIIELTLFDLRFKIKPSVDVWDRLTFIDIDDGSLTTIGEYPWKRDAYAKGLNSLQHAGAYTANLDIFFEDKSPVQIDNNAMSFIKQKIKNKKIIKNEEIENAIRNNDEIFAEGLRNAGNTNLVFQFYREKPANAVLERRETQEFKSALKIFKEAASIKVSEADKDRFSSFIDEEIVDISYPIPEIMNSAKGFGFSDRDIDVDGAFRRIRLVRLFQGRIYFNLALVMLMDVCNVAKEDVGIFPGEKIILKNAFNPVTQENKDLSIPIDDKGLMYVNWAGSGIRKDVYKVIPFYMIWEYEQDIVDDIYDFFDEMGTDGGNVKLSQFELELSKIIPEYLAESEPEKKLEKLEKIEKIRKNINDIKYGYAKRYEEDIIAVEKELEKKDDPGLREELKIMKEDLVMIKSVIKVEELVDCVALTGMTATGTVDIGITPLNNKYPRVGIYHNAINTILQEKHIKKLAPMLNYILMILIAVGIGFSVQDLDAKRSIVTIGLVLVALNVVTVLFFILFEIWIDQLGLNLSLIIPSVSMASVKFVKEESQKRFIKNAFSHYLAPGVINQIIENPESLELGGENRNLTIFFSDVAKFSTISEKLSPPELVSLLNEYLSEMTDIILSHGGTVDKYEGDAIMAFYGAPQAYDDHPLRCCLATIDMKKKLREMQEKWRKEGKDELYVRMGMNTGDAVVGNMGSKSRMDYTVMGDSVNLASRLEGANKFYSTYALISESTYKGAEDDIDARKLDIIRVVGKEEPILIYELLGRKGTLPDRMYDMLDKYYIGLDHFQNRQWKKALTYFEQGAKIIESDGPCLTYVGRCKDFMKKAPSKNWDGVYTFKTK